MVHTCWKALSTKWWEILPRGEMHGRDLSPHLPCELFHCARGAHISEQEELPSLLLKKPLKMEVTVVIICMWKWPLPIPTYFFFNFRFKSYWHDRAGYFKWTEQLKLDAFSGGKLPFLLMLVWTISQNIFWIPSHNLSSTTWHVSSLVWKKYFQRAQYIEGRIGRY